jgi:hypothetical protein
VRAIEQGAGGYRGLEATELLGRSGVVVVAGRAVGHELAGDTIVPRDGREGLASDSATNASQSL